MSQTRVVSQHLRSSIAKAIELKQYDKIFILTDNNTMRYCRAIIEVDHPNIYDITIPAGEENKTLQTLNIVWEQLQANNASRHSLMMCVGGGMVCDLGGMAAACYKRGFDHIHIPTTLLAMVDASIGGKTGVNLNHLKNEIGVFKAPTMVLVETEFLKTLSDNERLAGYAEMLKHALLSDRQNWARHLRYYWEEPDYDELEALILSSQQIKTTIVKADPLEIELRKSLNLGHTFGHAFEAFFNRKGRPVSHGYCVAWGLVCALYASHTQLGFPIDAMRQTCQYILNYFGRPDVLCKDYEVLYSLMLHDKKNVGEQVCFVLLEDIGKPVINNILDKETIFAALDFLREG
ncbi:MAG: 3-dehydroquinate synthase [Alloprevotella sp.]|nr:3-dehydroquinate synthase [Alloprevotella sp.]